MWGLGFGTCAVECRPGPIGVGYAGIYMDFRELYYYEGG
jgi:hypothetical protein